MMYKKIPLKTKEIAAYCSSYELQREMRNSHAISCEYITINEIDFGVCMCACAHICMHAHGCVMEHQTHPQQTRQEKG